MSMKHVKATTEHGVERIIIRATESQKHLINELRENKKLYIENKNSEYKLFNDGSLVRLLYKLTVEKLIEQEILQYLDPKTNKITLSVIAR